AFALLPMGPRLYDGYIGPGLFFSALHLETKEEAYRVRSDKIFDLLEEVLASPLALRGALRDGIGAFVGVGSIVYGLTLAETISENKRFLDLAERFLVEIFERRASLRRGLDLMNGYAGGALVL